MHNKNEDSFLNKNKNYSKSRNPIRFLLTWRPFPLYELISYFFMFASIPMLAYGIQNYNFDIVKIIFLTIITLYSAFFAALIWNDITDADIDLIVHPNRPVPTGRITKKRFFAVALIFSAFTFVFAFLINFWCLVLVGITALFVTFHNKYLKKMIKMPAYSEIFTPFQWIVVAIFGFLAVWMTIPGVADKTIYLSIFEPILINNSQIITMLLLVVFTYFADNAHDIAEGIHDFEGDKKLGVKTYATSFGEKTAAKISFFMFIFSGIIAIMLFITKSLSIFFIIPFVIVWVYTMYWPYKLIKADKNHVKELSTIVGRKWYDYLLMSYNFIFFDIIIQLIIYHLNIRVL